MIQDRGNEACNTHCHEAILLTLAHAPELMSQELIDICLAACRDDWDRVLMESVNTVIACKEFGSLELFSQICTPTTEEAKKVRYLPRLDF